MTVEEAHEESGTRLGKMLTMVILVLFLLLASATFWLLEQQVQSINISIAQSNVIHLLAPRATGAVY
jgi:hypothetical protein